MFTMEEIRDEIKRLSAEALNAISEDDEVKFFKAVSAINDLTPFTSRNEITFKILRLLCATIEDSEGEKEGSSNER